MHFNNALNSPFCQELNKNGQASTASPQVTCSYSAQDLLSKCTPGTKCTRAQPYFRVNIELSTFSSVQLFVKFLQFRSLNRVNMYDRCGVRLSLVLYFKICFYICFLPSFIAGHPGSHGLEPFGSL